MPALRTTLAAAFLLTAVTCFSQDYIPDTSLQRLRSRLARHLQENDKKNAVQDHLDIATAYSRLGNPKDAMGALFSALEITEELGDKKGTAHALYKIAVLYDRQDDPEHAIVYAQKGLKTASEVNDSATIASCLHRMGLAQITKEKYEEAEKNIQRSLEIRTKLGSKSGIGACLNAMGLICKETNRYEQAAQYMAKAYKLWQEAGDLEGIAIATGNLASLYYRNGDYPRSIEYGLISYRQARNINSYVFMKEACLDLSSSYEQLKDFEKAHLFYKKYSQIKDTLINEASAQKISLIQSQYESDKQEAEITSLQKDRRSQGQLRNMLIGAIVLFIGLVLVIFNRYRIKQRANAALQSAHKEILTSHDEIKAQKQEMTDSIRYAKKLQDALLPANKVIHALFPQCFVYYKPKDIVSGDFYWVEDKDDRHFIAAVDCTGHGVPGAFMSILGYSLLNRAVNELGLVKPDQILNELNKGVSRLLRQNKDEGAMKDGMDIALVAIDRKRQVLEFAGAFNSLYRVRGGELSRIEADKFPVGGYVDEQERSFSLQQLELKPEDVFYIFTDGYADQFGGPKIKKFRLKQLQELLLRIHTETMEKQKEILHQTLENWKGEISQVDDILVIGFRI